MPVFEYRAFDTGGNTARGILTADTPEEARQVLRGQGYHVKAIKGVRKRQMSFLRFNSRKEVTTVCRQLATLLNSGTNLSDALVVVMKQIEHPTLRSALMEILETIKRGASFGHALEEFPELFPPIFVSMVKAGESSGSLGVVLSRVADYYQNRKKVTGGLVAAMAYPIVVMLVAIIVVIILMTGVVPRLVEIIMKTSAGRVLPLPTRVLILGSTILRDFWWVLILAGVILTYTIYRILRSERGRYVFDRLLLKVPIAGSLFEKTAVARFATTFATLLESGITPLDGLVIVQDILNNKYLEEAIQNVRRGVIDGHDMSAEFERTGVFPPIVGHMVSVGEESGELQKLLKEIAEAYEVEVELATEKLIAVIEPVMIIFMAVVIGFIVFAVILPIVEIGNIQ